ncbi:MAG: tetratricopeptide repeat protein [Gammaproteobacteria bacterium]|nr:tetratricopeptide repeat protein [Gammaproteobacteria bacterium]
MARAHFSQLVLVAILATAGDSHGLKTRDQPDIATGQVEFSLERRLAAATTPAERATVWGNEGMLLHAQRRLGEAQDAYHQAIDEHESARWRYLHGVALAESGALAESITDFRRAVVLAPDNMPAWYRLGTALLQAGDAAAAATALEQARVLAPKSALVFAALADVSILLGEPKEALALLSAAFRMEPEAGQLAYKIASVHRRLGHVAKAQAWLERDPGNRLAPTIDDPILLEVASLSRTPRFYRMAADWALARGDVGAAIDALRNAVSLAPSDVALHERLAAVLAEHAPREALADVERLLEMAPDSATGWRLLAWVLRLAPNASARAAQAAARSLALADLPATRVLAAALAMRDGRFDTAMSHYRHLTEAQPTEPHLHYWLGMSQLAAGDCQGVPPLQEALRLHAEWGEALLALARAEAICGETKGPDALSRATARAAALLRAREGPDTRLTLAFVLLAAGDVEAAADIARQQAPHPDATMLLEAIDHDTVPNTPFAPESAWWIPPEIRLAPEASP